MAESGSRAGKARDARRTREAILDAAEAVFAQHGFSGARIDAIAQASGYNTGLLFRYFDDKLGLYAEVLKRADREANALLERVLAPLLADETAASHERQWRRFLETMVQTLFDYLLDHPRFARMLTWEMAEGGQTLPQIASQFPTEVTRQFEMLFQKAHSAGLLRSDFAPVIQLTMILQMCQTYLVSLPLYQQLLPDEDLSSPGAFTRARKYLVDFVVAGMMADPEEAKL